MATKTRCPWAGTDPLMIDYHDHEWGVPIHDDHTLFEFLILEGAQAGLSWSTVLKKRDAYARVFADFDPAKVARFTAKHIDKATADPGIIRNRLKVSATVRNARAFLEIQHERGTFHDYAWDFVGGKPIIGKRKAGQPIPATSPESDALSKELKRRGFSFVGSTIIYAYMQAVGMVNDHLVTCFRFKEVQKARSGGRRRAATRAQRSPAK